MRKEARCESKAGKEGAGDSHVGHWGLCVCSSLGMELSLNLQALCLGLVGWRWLGTQGPICVFGHMCH